MSVPAVIRAARAAGLELALSPAGRIAFCGPASLVELFKPALVENRDAIIQVLASEAVTPPLEERRASVEKLLDQMQAENERRQGWWRKTPDGWPHAITLRSALSGEATVIRFPKGGRAEAALIGLAGIRKEAERHG